MFEPYLLATKGTTNLGTVSRDIDVDDTTVRARRTDPLENRSRVRGEDRARQTLGNAIVDGNRFIQSLKKR